MNRSFTSPPYTTSGGGSPLRSLFSEAVSRGSSEPTVASSADSRLLDAAQTLVTLQQTSGASPTGHGHQHQQRRQQQQQQHQQQLVHVNKRGINDLFRDDFGPVSLTSRAPSTPGSRMPPTPVPPTSSSGTLQPMGPPPPPPSSSGNNVTTRYVVLQTTSQSTSSRGSVMSDSIQQSRILQAHSDQGTMQPPSQPPPSRRGRGSKRGTVTSHSVSTVVGPPSAPSPSGRGRGRGRGRGSKSSAQTGAATVQSTVVNPMNMFESDDPEDAEMMEGGEGLTSQAEEEEKRRRKNGTTFQVGSLAVRNDIFDELLNERKLELLLDPEIMAVLEKHRLKPNPGRNRTLSNSSSGFVGWLIIFSLCLLFLFKFKLKVWESSFRVSTKAFTRPNSWFLVST